MGSLSSTTVYGNLTIGSNNQVIPVGSMMFWTNATPPTNYMICDGTSLNLVVYPALYNVIGYTYGGSANNFSLPNFTGKHPLGKNDSGYASALNDSGGAINHTHTASSHNHSLNSHTHTLNAHTHLLNHSHTDQHWHFARHSHSLSAHTHGIGAHTHTGTTSDGSGTQVVNGTGTKTATATSHTHSYTTGSNNTTSGGPSTDTSFQGDIYTNSTSVNALGSNNSATAGPSSDSTSASTGDTSADATTVGVGNSLYTVFNVIIRYQ